MGPTLIGMIAMAALTVSSAMARSDLRIRYTGSSELYVNDLLLNEGITTEKLMGALGSPSRTADYPSGETSYFYDEAGVVFFTKEGFVKGLGINYNWDGDEKFPEAIYSGSLSIGELDITKETTRENVSSIGSVGFLCPIPLLCASKDRTALVVCTVAFKDEHLPVTQVVFIMGR